MQFDPTDIADILAATGEDIVVKLGAVTVRTDLRVKFRKDFESFSPGEMSVGTLNPAFMCATADMADITSANTFIRSGTEYRMNGKSQDLSSGFTRVTLAKK